MLSEEVGRGLFVYLYIIIVWGLHRNFSRGGFSTRWGLKTPCNLSHTAEAFWTLSILPFRKLGIFKVIKFLFQLKGDQLPPTFKKRFIQGKETMRTPELLIVCLVTGATAIHACEDWSTQSVI